MLLTSWPARLSQAVLLLVLTISENERQSQRSPG
jgi:hypothetical protein